MYLTSCVYTGALPHRPRINVMSYTCVFPTVENVDFRPLLTHSHQSGHLFLDWFGESISPVNHRWWNTTLLNGGEMEGGSREGCIFDCTKGIIFNNLRLLTCQGSSCCGLHTSLVPFVSLRSTSTLRNTRDGRAISITNTHRPTITLVMIFLLATYPNLSGQTTATSLCRLIRVMMKMEAYMLTLHR